MKNKTFRYLFLLLTVFFVGTGLAFGDTVVILLGDVNRDGQLDVADITAITNYVHGTATDIDATAADVNRDGAHDVADIIGVTNIVHHGTPTGSTTESILFFTATEVAKNYGDAPFATPIVRAGSTGAITYAVTPASGVVTVAADGTVTIVGIGTATITATLAGSSDFGTTTASYTVTVTSTTPTVTTAPVLVSGSLTYTTADQALVASAEGVTGGTVKYYVIKSDTDPTAPTAGTGDWTTTVPTGKDAGKYYVWYYVEGDANHNSSAVQSLGYKEISKATTSSDITANNITIDPAIYNDGTAVTPNVTVTLGSENVTSQFTITYSNNTNAGTGTVTVTPNSTGNFTGAAITKDFTIDKANPTVTTPPALVSGSLTYTTADQALVASAEGVTGGTVKYYVIKSDTDPTAPTAGTGDWTTTVPTGKDAGKYYVWYYVEGDANHNSSAVQSLGYKEISKATTSSDITANNITIDPAIYNDGTAVTPNVTVTLGSENVTSQFTITYSNNTNAGTGTVTVTPNATGNFTGAAITKDFTIEKVDAAVTAVPTLVTGDLSYNESAQTLLASGGTATGGTMKYFVIKSDTEPAAPTITDTSWTPTPTATDAGTYYIWYYVEGDANHNSTAVQRIADTKTISKATVTNVDDTMTTPVTAKENLINTGVELELVTAGVSKAGTLMYQVTTTSSKPAKTEGTWTETVPKAAATGTYYVWYYAAGNDNYEATDVCNTSVEVIIKQKGNTSPIDDPDDL